MSREGMNPVSEVYNMDCSEYMRTIPDKWFDLAIVDPPYFAEANLHYFHGGTVTIRGIRRKNYHRSCAWNVPSQKYYDELLRVSKNQIIWGINYFKFDNIPFGRVIWDKKRAGLIDSFSDAEIASCSLINGVRMFRYRWDGMLQENMKKKEIKIHVTQKPVALYKWLLDKYAKPGDKIFDSHLGSGSSRIASYKMGFDFYATEIDEIYFNAQEERFRRECHGEYRESSGQIITQKQLFDES